MSKKISVTAHVTTRRNKPGSKHRLLTDVTIRLDGKLTVAFRTVPGAWNVEEALKEFRKAPERFQPHPATTAEAVATYAKVA